MSKSQPLKTECFVVRFHTGQRYETGLCVKKKVLHLVSHDGKKVRHHTQPISALRNMSVIENTTVPKARKSLRRQGRVFGITKQAKKWLKREAAL